MKLGILRREPKSRATESEKAAVFSRFPFLGSLEAEVDGLIGARTKDKIEALAEAAEFLNSPRSGGRLLEDVVQILAASGYPAASARYELSLLPKFLASDFLNATVSSPTALTGGAQCLDGEFTEVSPSCFIAGFPVGPVLVVGSGNSLMPAIVSAVESIIANCPVALRGSRTNHRALAELFSGLKKIGSSTLGELLERVHLFYLDEHDPREAADFGLLLRNGPFSAGNFWGGREALDFLVSEFAKNPRHPRIIPMEPMTGVAVVSEAFINHDADHRTDASVGLAQAISVMGQQLCSSPTEGYFIGDWQEAVRFGEQVSRALEGIAVDDANVGDESRSLLLDRIREHLEEAGSRVFTPGGGSPGVIVVTAKQSGFMRIPSDLHLQYHRRGRFLELIVLDNLEEAARHIQALPAAPCHQGLKGVQTVIRLTSLGDAQRLFLALRAKGVYRIVPPEYVVMRHAFEPLDGRNLLYELTSQAILF
jgi:Acyl-CoA reductase (LuxC)